MILFLSGFSGAIAVCAWVWGDWRSATAAAAYSALTLAADWWVER